ncbi:hypothetical protein FOZ63_010339, partial [Perkinsus olseni]
YHWYRTRVLPPQETHKLPPPPLPAGTQLLPYDHDTNTCTVVSTSTADLLTFKTMSGTFLSSIFCGSVQYEFENGYGIALSVGGRRQTFASSIEDPMMAMAAFGIRRRSASHFDDLVFGREVFGSVLNFASNNEDTMSVIEGYGLKEEPDDTVCGRGVELIQSRFGLRG